MFLVPVMRKYFIIMSAEQCTIPVSIPRIAVTRPMKKKSCPVAVGPFFTGQFSVRTRTQNPRPWPRIAPSRKRIAPTKGTLRENVRAKHNIENIKLHVHQNLIRILQMSYSKFFIGPFLSKNINTEILIATVWKLNLISFVLDLQLVSKGDKLNVSQCCTSSEWMRHKFQYLWNNTYWIWICPFGLFGLAVGWTRVSQVNK